MLKVNNKKAINNISNKSLKANFTRNLLAIVAIALTTIMFTTVFTIGATIVNSFQQENFRQAGGDFPLSFKDVTLEQIEELKKDPMLIKTGSRQILGMPLDEPFNKTHVEVSYTDKVGAEGSFCKPEVGDLPKEGTDEIACDSRIISLLGAKKELGEKITFSYYIGVGETKRLITDTFTLSGYWEYDEASMASHAIVPLSYNTKILENYERNGSYDLTGSWTLNTYLKSVANIEKDAEKILSKAGYQCNDQQADNFIDIGVNWGYLNAQLSSLADGATMAGMAGVLIIIIFTGYLIIYNIFQISVYSDIRFYGLLKTIGTTGKQLKRIIMRQALFLSAIGIPIGLALGYLCGNILAPYVMSTLSVTSTYVTANPLIFIGSAIFALVTVLISCRKPGKIASKVSPIEAVKLSENTGVKKKSRKGSDKVNVLQMAIANLSRNKKKTVLVIASLSLTVLLLQVTFTFTGGFDMDKYLKSFVVSDFILGDASYFQVGGELYNSEDALSENAIAAVKEQKGVADGGRIFGKSSTVESPVKEEEFINMVKTSYRFASEEDREKYIKNAERDESGKVYTDVQLYGMEKYPLDKVNVIDGDLSDVYDPDKNAIAALYLTDDYGKPKGDSNPTKVGDEIVMRYFDGAEYKTVTYDVVACVTITNAMGYRYYGSSEYILNSEVFKRDTGTSNVMTYLIDVEEEAIGSVTDYLENYTTKVDPTLDYESKQDYVEEFNGFRNMFMLMGGALSFIIGMIGILNFFNAVMTSIMSRKREFAMLQSIGMEGRQLKAMLVYEGIYYGILSVVISLTLTLATAPLLGSTLSTMFWFFTYKFTIWPILIITPIFILLGVMVPLIMYSIISKQTIVERLREAE